MTCCDECTCTTNCTLTGTCCPDAVIEPTGPSSCFAFGQSLYRPKSLSRHLSKIIKTCPQNSKEAERSLCETETDFNTFVFVSDTNMHQLYQNNWCALCNGVTSAISWEIYAYNCQSLVDSRFRHPTFNNRDIAVLTNCNLVGVRHDANRDSCLMEQISIIEKTDSCNISPINEVSLPYQKCFTNGKDPRHLYEIGTGENKIRKLVSPYCYACNAASGEQLCEEPSNFTDIDKITSEKSLLVLSKNYDVTDLTTYKYCKEKDVFDRKLVRLYFFLLHF